MNYFWIWSLKSTHWIKFEYKSPKLSLLLGCSDFFSPLFSTYYQRVFQRRCFEVWNRNKVYYWMKREDANTNTETKTVKGSTSPKKKTKSHFDSTLCVVIQFVWKCTIRKFPNTRGNMNIIHWLTFTNFNVIWWRCWEKKL